ncbi:hypothetical protein [Sediminibacillus massiliensis]|uniref:hypothetical protein n=1 Tax=Sediminibacillus massiliensis TaxID=1926277 RepID=UPI00098877C8|nr:hypothetical protein [Sediminibacillus massiliensis]
MRKRNNSLIFVLGSIGIATFVIIFLVYFIFSPGNQARRVVDDFNRYEQEGMFAESYGLFHSLMKEKFDKGHYIQDRAHVFMNHFGVETFAYSIDDVDKLKNWRMAKESEPLEEVFKVTVTQVYKGKYGNFKIVQDVYAAKDDNKWTILWSYWK